MFSDEHGSDSRVDVGQALRRACLSFHTDQIFHLLTRSEDEDTSSAEVGIHCALEHPSPLALLPTFGRTKSPIEITGLPWRGYRVGLQTLQ